MTINDLWQELYENFLIDVNLAKTAESFGVDPTGLETADIARMLANIEIENFFK